MNLKAMLYQKGLKQVDLVRHLGIDPGRVSLQVNGIRPLPEKHLNKLCELLGVSKEELQKLCSNMKGDALESVRTPGNGTPRDIWHPRVGWVSKSGVYTENEMCFVCYFKDCRCKLEPYDCGTGV